MTDHILFRRFPGWKLSTAARRHWYSKRSSGSLPTATAALDWSR